MAKRKTGGQMFSYRTPIDPTGILLAKGVTCAASTGCTNPLVPDCPVHLCAKHLREVYEFAHDLVENSWDEAVRGYVAELHTRFRPPRAVTKRTPGNLYFIRFGDRIKVGYSTNPEVRIAELPHEEVLGIVPGTRSDEKSWHRLLADFHVTGEWFRADPEVLAMIARVVAG